MRFISEEQYEILSPAPILFSGIYGVGFEYFPATVRDAFLSGSDFSIDWVAEAFKIVYNRYFATEDYYIPETAAVTEASLRPLITTMNLGDDEPEMTWHGFVEYQTGYPLRDPGAEVMAFSMGKAGRLMGNGAHESNVLYTHFQRHFTHSPTKNRLFQQGGVWIHIVGNWGNPLVTDNEGSAAFDIQQLTNRDDFLIKNMDEDSDKFGEITMGSEISYNLFTGGDIYVPDTNTTAAGNQDVDPDTLGGSAEKAGMSVQGGEDAGTYTTNAKADGLDIFRFTVESWTGASFLTLIPHNLV